MFYRNRIVVVGMVCLGLNLAACSSERDVEVTGTVSAASGVMVGSSIALQFIDADQDHVKPNPVKATARLSKLGDFEQTVGLEGEQVLVRAIDDRNGDGWCSEGEAWGQTIGSVDNDEAKAISVTLAVEPCPFGGE